MPNEARQLDPAVAEDLARLALALSHDKKHRKAFGKLVREALPDSPHAAAFQDVDVEDRFERLEADRQAKELERQQQAQLDRMNRQRAALLSGGEGGEGPKYSEEDVGKIEALMQKKGIVDYEDGRVLYAATQPPPSPQPPTNMPGQHGATWEFPEWGKFGADPVKASRDTANTVITEFMRKR